MRTIVHLLVAASALVYLGCANQAPSYQADGFGGAPRAAFALAPESSAPAVADRKIIWRGSLHLKVGNVSNAIIRIATLVETHRGYIESTQGSEEESWITIRLPADRIRTTIAEIEQIGDVTYRDISSTDVTEEYVDIEARRGNLIALRDRLRALLDGASEVKDVVAIEAELNRVQSELDSLNARIKALLGQIDFATLHVRLARKPILGPLGYLAKGVWWVVEKLFVIRR